MNDFTLHLSKLLDFALCCHQNFSLAALHTFLKDNAILTSFITLIRLMQCMFFIKPHALLTPLPEAIGLSMQSFHRPYTQLDTLSFHQCYNLAQRSCCSRTVVPYNKKYCWGVNYGDWQFLGNLTHLSTFEVISCIWITKFSTGWLSQIFKNNILKNTTSLVVTKMSNFCVHIFMLQHSIRLVLQ